MAQVSKINMGGIDYDIRDKVLEQEVANIKPIVNQGTINNAADEEDLTSENNLLKLKDRQALSGMGYVILRKNKTFAEQVNDANTIYEIRYDFTISGNVKLPQNCILIFNGGAIIDNNLTYEVDLNGAFIQGNGVRCKVYNVGGNTIRTSQCSIIGSIDTQYNRSILEYLLQKDICVCVDSSAEFSDAIYMRNIKLYGKGDCLLSFPSSRGFVFSGQNLFSANNVIDGVNISSLSHCVDFDGGENKADSIYWSRFANITAMSEQGNCFNAGTGVGKNDDKLTFNNVFENINVKATQGCGFYGIYGIETVFRNIISRTCAEAVFFNCAGKFDHCNTTFESSPVFLKARSEFPIRLICEFSSCNFEDYSDKIFDCWDANVYCHMSFNSNFIWLSKGGEIKDYPFKFYYLYNLTFFNNIIMNEGSYAQGITMLRVAHSNDLIYTGDESIEVVGAVDGAFHFVLDSVSGKREMIYMEDARWGRQFLPRYQGAIIEELYVKNSGDIAITQIVANLNVNLLGGDFINFAVEADKDVIGGNVELHYYTLPPISRQLFKRIKLCNTCQNATITIKHNIGYLYRFICEGGNDIVLHPKECVEAILLVNGYSSIADAMPCYVYQPIRLDYKPAYARPTLTNMDIGREFFDLVTNRPIWYKGDGKWVDATGAEV